MNCNECKNRRMCHKRRDTEINVDVLVSIIGRDMRALSEVELENVRRHEGGTLGNSKNAHLRQVVTGILRDTTLTCMANLCSAYCEEKLIELVSPGGKMKARYSPDAAQRMMDAHGVDIAKEIPKLLALEEIAQSRGSTVADILDEYQEVLKHARKQGGDKEVT